MNPCHAAALALVGWYLMLPPLQFVGHRGRENQRAGCRDDQHGEQSKRVVRERINTEADAECNWGEPHCVAVGQSLEWRLAGQRRSHEIHDPGVLALSGDSGDLDGQRALAVDTAA